MRRSTARRWASDITSGWSGDETSVGATATIVSQCLARSSRSETAEISPQMVVGASGGAKTASMAARGADRTCDRATRTSAATGAASCAGGQLLLEAASDATDAW